MSSSEIISIEHPLLIMSQNIEGIKDWQGLTLALLSIESLEGSYGCSLDGISSTAGMV